MWLFVPLPSRIAPGSVTSCAAAMHWPDLWKCLRHCLLPAALQPRRFCQFSVTLMGLIIFELCSCTVFFSSIFVVFCFSYFVGLTIHKFVFEVGPKGRRQLGEKIIVVVAGTCSCRCSCRCCCCCCCCCSCRCKVPIVVATACDVLCHCLISF